MQHSYRPGGGSTLQHGEGTPRGGGSGEGTPRGGGSGGGGGTLMCGRPGSAGGGGGGGGRPQTPQQRRVAQGVARQSAQIAREMSQSVSFAAEG